jgi:CDGSH-type Zn-finger protein
MWHWLVIIVAMSGKRFGQGVQAMAQSLAARGMKVTIGKDGPYRVSGGVPSAPRDHRRRTRPAIPWPGWRISHPAPPARPISCAVAAPSKTKPFCDGSHAEIGFDGTETASRAPYLEQAGVLEGPALVLADAEALCAYGRFCDRAGKVWNTVAEARTPTERAAFIEQVGQCPSGRLVALDRETGEAVEPELPPSIALVEDPQQNCAGPLWVRGGIAIADTDGTAWEVRNRVTLCRCGASNNKPFCDGSHASIGFKDA